MQSKLYTMKKSAQHGDLVVRVCETKTAEYLEDGWHLCPVKVWRRSKPAMKKDGTGYSKRVRLDPVRHRK